MSGDEAAPVVAAAEPAAGIPGEPMDIMTALQLTLRKSLAYGGLARGLHEGAKVIEKNVAQLCVLAEDCDQPDYVKLVKALCAEHNVSLLTVPSAKTLGEWAGEDAGVHSFSNVCHVDSERISIRRPGEVLPLHEPAVVKRAVNHFLQHDSNLMVIDVRCVPSDFHARCNAQERTYFYRLLSGLEPLSTFEKDRAWHVQEKLNLHAMQAACKILVGDHDFSSSRAAGCQVSIQDDIPSDLTLSTSSSGDVDDCFTGVDESETLSCSSVSTHVGVQNKAVNDSIIIESNPESSALAKPNNSKPTDKKLNLTQKFLKIAADLERESKITRKDSHFHSNFSATSLPRRTDHHMGKFSSSSNPTRHGIFPSTNCRTNERFSNVNDRFLPRDRSKSGESEITMEHSNQQVKNFSSFSNPSSHAIPPTNYKKNTRVSNVNDRFLLRGNRPRSGEPKMAMERNDQQLGKFSSVSNPRHGFPLTNHRENERVCNVKDRFLAKDKFQSGESEIAMELTRGPRGGHNNIRQESSAVKDGFAITISRDKYNLSDFKTEYETAKFYVIKSFNEDDIHKCINYDVWASTYHGNQKLNAAFHDAEAKSRQTGVKCPIFLFFSVNASGQFVGVAEMLGPVDFNKDMKFWKVGKYNGFFPVKWHIIKDVPNNQLQHIIHEGREHRPVTYSRDTQEIGLKQGLEMLKIFKSYSAKTSLLDDFDFYENREKLFRSRKSIKPTTPKQEVYGNNNYHCQSWREEDRVAI